jgi:hypothetical protein
MWKKWLSGQHSCSPAHGDSTVSLFHSLRVNPFSPQISPLPRTQRGFIDPRCPLLCDPPPHAASPYPCTSRLRILLLCGILLLFCCCLLCNSSENQETCWHIQADSMLPNLWLPGNLLPCCAQKSSALHCAHPGVPTLLSLPHHRDPLFCHRVGMQAPPLGEGKQ